MSDQPRKRGRRPNPEPSGSVCAWLTASEHDAICEIARLNRLSVSQVIARALRISLLKKYETRQTA
jgi:hypothetical protein